LLFVREMLAALLATSTEGRDYLVSALSLENTYLVVTFPGKAVNEPFSGDADLDGDGMSNADEAAAIIGGGGDIDNFVAAAVSIFIIGVDMLPISGRGTATVVVLICLAAASTLAMRRRTHTRV
jgi:hypothetical protein